MILEQISAAVEAGARRAKACEVLGLSVRTVERWAHSGADARHGPKSTASSALTEAERTQVLETATSVEFRGVSPKQIVPTLADRGEYIASESSFYRLLKATSMDTHRRRERPRVARPHEHEATGPWQLISWDITYMNSPVRGMYYFLYVFMDVWSRKIVGWEVHDVESSELSSALVEKIERDSPNGINLAGVVIHSDNGGPMKGATMLATLERLGVVKSFSRPRVSDDNPYSESLFRTLKYVPEYPQRFSSIDHARDWVAAFVSWYNAEHLHSGIGYVTPESRHTGNDAAILANRRAVYSAARLRHPARWSGSIRKWDKPESVVLNPGHGKAQQAAAA